ncbi:MAG TPA: response regulator [Pseudonocardiaceae bacterium]|jgi:hypothetical protein|nr:response regulator [Pseudonocardiaceae bacterium]
MDATVVELLDGDVVIRVGTELLPVTGPTTRLLVATLAMRAPESIAAEVLQQKTGQATKEALWKMVSRLRTDLDLDIARVGNGYVLRLDPMLIDARRFVAVARRPRAELTYDDVVAASELWRSGPPDLGDASLWRTVLAAKETLDRRLRDLAPHRLLIVEDKVGDRLRKVLGQYKCEVIHDLDAFWPILPDIDERFDAALVDMNLSPDYQDRDGEQVLDAISRSRSRLPVIVMTAMMPKGFNVAAYLRRFNLAGFVTKCGDDQTADFSAIASAVHELFEGDITTTLCERLEDDLPRIGRQARKWLERQGRQADEPRMRNEHERLAAIARRGDLAELRSAVAAFEERYGSPSARG